MLNSDVLSQLKKLKKDIREATNQHSGSIKGSPGRFGFVVLDDGKECFLNPDEMQKVFPGDRITAEINEDEKGRSVATVIAVEESRLTYFVGRYIIRGKGHFVEPDLAGLNRWIFIPPKKRRQSQAGDYILCRVLQHPFEEGKPQAEVVKNLGKQDQSGLPTNYALAKYNLGGKNPGHVDDAQIKKHIEGQIKARRDMRDISFITIDAETTQDLDDALYAEKLNSGWKLMVAIADPAEFVAIDSDADKYAKRLGSSHYFPDRVLPMLHPRLANHYCSLQPLQDRLALVCELYLDDSGAVGSGEMHEAVISSKARFSYQQASALLAGKSSEQPKVGEQHNDKTDENQTDTDTTEQAQQQFAQQLKDLQVITTLLRNKRKQEALVTGDKTDYQLILDSNKKIEKIIPRTTTPAHALIEEAMIATNRATADFLKNHSKEALYTAHSGFRPERLEQIKTVVDEQCKDFDSSKLASWEGLKTLLNYLQNQQTELPLEAIANRMLTRGTLSKTPAPHAGMGLAEYTTFTSPIRKYADLTVHRIIKAILHQHQNPASRLSNKALDRLQESLRNGRSAIRESEHWLKCEYAQKLIGESFTGRVQHTNGSGFQVRLDDSGMDGVVNLGSVDEKFKFDGTRFQHIGENRKFCLEQSVKVKISAVDMDKKQIAMVLEE